MKDKELYKELEYTFTLELSVIDYAGNTVAIGARRTAIELIASLLEARLEFLENVEGIECIKTFEEFVEEEGAEWYKDAFSIRAEYAKVFNASLIRAELQGVYEVVLEKREEN